MDGPTPGNLQREHTFALHAAVEALQLAELADDASERRDPHAYRAHTARRTVIEAGRWIGTTMAFRVAPERGLNQRAVASMIARLHAPWPELRPSMQPTSSKAPPQ